MLGICPEGRPDIPDSRSVRARPFSGANEHECQQRGERNAHAGPDEALLDRVTHEKDAAERQRDAADPHRPLGAEAFLEAHRRRGHRGRRRNGRNGRGGRRALGRRHRWGHRLRHRRNRCIGLGNRLCRSGCCRSRTGGGRRTLDRLQPRIDATQLPAEVHGLHQRDDGEKGSPQSNGREQEEEQFHGRIAEPRCVRCYRTRAPRQRRAPFSARPVGVNFPSGPQIGRFTMRRDHVDRRAVVTGATFAGRRGLLPVRVNAQSGTMGQRTGPSGPPPLPARGEFVVRGANVLTMDPGSASLRAATCTCATAPSSQWAPNVAAPGAEVIDGRGMICMPGFVDTHWHLWTSVLRPIVRADDPSATATSRSRRGSARTSRRRTAIAACGSASPKRSAPASPPCTTGRTTCAVAAHADAELARHARHRHPRALRLRHAAGRAQRSAHGPCRPRPGETRLARRTTACSRSASARATSAAIPIPCAATSRRDGEEGMGRGARARAADHPAHFGTEPGEASRRCRPARPRRAARASAADHRGGARDAQESAA